MLIVRLGLYFCRINLKECSWVSSHEYPTSDNPGLERAFKIHVVRMHMCLFTGNVEIVLGHLFLLFLFIHVPSSNMHGTWRAEYRLHFWKWTLQMFKQLPYSCALVCYVCPDHYSQLLSKYLAVQIKIVQMTSLLLLLLIVSSGIKSFYFEVWSLFGIRASGFFVLC